MVIKKKNGVFGEQTPEIQLPKWMLTKWFLYLFTAVVLVMVIGFSLLASTRDNLANAIFAKTATDVSVVKPPSGVENPLVIGAATPTSTEGKKKIKNKTGDPSGAATPIPTIEQPKAGKIALGYVEGYTLDMKPNTVYITSPASNTNPYQGHLLIKKEDLPKISSLAIGKTVLTNFRTKATGGVDDWGLIEADISQPRKHAFLVSMGTYKTAIVSDQNSVIYGGTSVNYGTNNPTFVYSVVQWNKAIYLTISISSP